MAITKYDVDYKPAKRNLITFSGVVEVEGSFAKRLVCLYKHPHGLLVDSTYSNAATGAWSISTSGNANDKYFAVCIPTASDRNADIFAVLGV